MRLKQISASLGALGLLLIFAGLMALYVTSEWNWFAYGAMIAGGALALIYVGLNLKEIIDAVSQRGALQTANAVLMSLLVIALLGFVTFLAGKHSYRHDTTAAKQFSLADQTKKVLTGLQDDLTITAFYLSTEQDAVSDLLKEYASVTPKFQYEFVDPDKQPDLVKRFDVTAYNTLVVSYHATDEKITASTEEGLTNAIIKVTREKKKKIYFTSKHGEKNPDSEERLGLSIAEKMIKDKNYEVGAVALMDSGRVPSDCSVLVIAGPETPFLQPEIEMIQKYLKLGGAVLVLTDPDGPSFNELVSDYGIKVGDDMIVDYSGIGQLFNAGPNMPVVSSYGDHAITEDFGEFMTAFPIARSVTVPESKPTGVEASAFAKTNPRSWAETKLSDLSKGKVALDDDDLRGPVSLAAAATRSASANLGADTTGEGAKDSRLVVFGDSDFAANYLFEFQKNGDLFMNALSWLAEEEDLISIGAKDPEDRRISLTDSGSKVVLLVSVFLLPLASFLAAIAIYRQRR